MCSADIIVNFGVLFYAFNRNENNRIPTSILYDFLLFLYDTFDRVIILFLSEFLRTSTKEGEHKERR